MKPVTLLLSCACGLAMAQTSDAPPKFEIADVHLSPKTANPFVSNSAARGRYEVKFGTMVDLVRLAYGFDADKILGGPNWLELDRFDIVAKLPPDSTPDTEKLMLQALLAERFKLVAHKDTRPLPAYALVAGKKPQLKEAEPSDEPGGCHPQAAPAVPGENTIRLMMTSNNGPTQSFTLGPGGILEYSCRNMTMAAFAESLHGLVGTSLGQAPISDETGLRGKWNFDFRYSMTMIALPGSSGDRISIFDAVEKQLGLKLEERQAPTPVMVVDSVNRKPTDNLPGVAEALPPTPVPTEFEVASVKPADESQRMMMMPPRLQPGGRFSAQGMPLRMYVNRAFNANSNDLVVGLPAWADTERFDVVAKVATEGAPESSIDNEAMARLIRSLLVDRFKMTYHTEERPVSAYSLVAARPKLKKADPNSRIFCKNGNAPPGAPAGTRVLTCQNATMAMFAERLQNLNSDLNIGVADTTELEGGWDFALTYSNNLVFAARAGMEAAVATAGGSPASAAASDPTGGYTIFEALEKQLGLKLEKQKRTITVTVIDRIEQKPTEN